MYYISTPALIILVVQSSLIGAIIFAAAKEEITNFINRKEIKKQNP